MEILRKIGKAIIYVMCGTLLNAVIFFALLFLVGGIVGIFKAIFL